ncbi:Dynein heavy chain 10, axonemal [Irineochytrium annulatum]|nr:Dynein heavy chain 10, axonemal [Irineochytrium annulatum]
MTVPSRPISGPSSPLARALRRRSAAASPAASKPVKTSTSCSDLTASITITTLPGLTTWVNPQLSSAAAAPPPPTPPRPQLPYIPNELILFIFSFCPTSTLLKTRLSSRRLKLLTDATLQPRLHALIVNLSAAQEDAEELYSVAERERRPHLRHYRNFLRNTTTSEVTEATWYASPPQELKTVCECLCILSGDVVDGKKQTEPISSTEPASLPWSTIKRHLSRASFKTWLTTLRASAHLIPISSIKRVERIIMLDANVTYERLREVSMAGYRLLIIVAACLQYCTIAEEVDGRRRVRDEVEGRLERVKGFMAMVEGRGSERKERLMIR